MSSPIVHTCAHCRRPLTVPPAYLGQWVACNHCDHAFLATLTPVGSSTRFDPDVGSEWWGLADSLAATETREYFSSSVLGTPSSVAEFPRAGSDADVALLAQQSLEADLQAARDENQWLITQIQRLEAELARASEQREQLKQAAASLEEIQAECSLAQDRERGAAQQARQMQSRIEELEQSCFENEARAESVRLDHVRQLDDAVRLWELQQREMGERRAEEVALLHERLEALESQRDSALEQLRRLQAEHQRCEERESQWERTLGENECRHRTEIDTLAHELRTARQQAALTMQHERELSDQNDALQHALATQCELPGDDAGDDPTAEESWPPPVAVVDRERHSRELSWLQEQIAEREQKLHEAIDQAGMLRLDRDRLHDTISRLEARLQAAEDREHSVVEQWSQDIQEALARQQDAARREAELLARLASNEPRVPATDVLAPDPSPDPDAKPGACGGEEIGLRPGKPAQPELLAGSREETARAADSGTLFEMDDLAETSGAESAPGDTVSPPAEAAVESAGSWAPEPSPLSEESPETRILQLRSALRAHEAASKHRGCGRVLDRISRLWKKHECPR